MATRTQLSADAAMPDLAGINRAALWLAYFRRLQDRGTPLTEARRLADERSGFTAGT